MTPLLLWTHLAATWFLVGLIWFVQSVHYPLMKRVGRGEFVDYETSHVRATGRVVVVPMLVEAACAAALVVRLPGPLTLLGGALLALVWISTAFFQVPAHRRLERGFDPAAHARLVRSNWVRTAAWTLRGLVAIAIAGRGA